LLKERRKGRRGMAEVIARVISQKGNCAAGHKVGDEFLIGDKTPPGMCAWSYYTLFPFATVMQYGGSFPWEERPDRTTTVACPDPDNPVVFELRRRPTPEGRRRKRGG
jgi:uncharacterized repeat protein (TIGR04076 family)